MPSKALKRRHRIIPIESTHYLCSKLKVWLK
jgi:hypothetical protein